MALWDKVREGIDKAGKAAQGAIDDGKLRLDAYRAREQADKAAEALGYAVYRAIDSGRELEAEARDRLVAALRSRENEAKRFENELAQEKARNEAAGGAPSSPPPPPDAPPSGSAPGQAPTG